MQVGGRDFPLNPKNMDSKDDEGNPNTNTVLKRGARRVRGVVWAEQLPQNKELQSSEAAQHAGKDSGVRIGFSHTLLVDLKEQFPGP